MPPRNDSGLTDEQKRAAVDRALELMGEGLSQKQAAQRAADELGVSEASVRRWADSQGRSLSRVTDAEARQRTAQATRVVRSWSLEDYRRWVNEAGALVDEGLKDILVTPGVDLDRLSKVTTVMKRVIEVDTRLDLRGAGFASSPDDGEEQVEANRLVLMLKDLAEHDRWMEESGFLREGPTPLERVLSRVDREALMDEALKHAEVDAIEARISRLKRSGEQATADSELMGAPTVTQTARMAEPERTRERLRLMRKGGGAAHEPEPPW